VLRPNELETTAMGVAYLAGLAKGVWQSTQAISDAWQLEKTFSPVTQPTGYETWRTAVKRSMNWVK
jgi:glycerol kinase